MTKSVEELETIKQRLLVFLDEQVDGSLDPASVTPETTLGEGLGIGSLQAVSLAMDVEDEFDITIEDAELASLKTVGDVLALIAKKTNPATT